MAYLIYFLMNYTSKNEENLENDYLNIKSEEINYDYPTLNDELFVDKLDNIFKQKLSKISWKQFHKSVCSRQKQEFRAAVGNLIQNIDALGGGCLDSRHRNRHY